MLKPKVVHMGTPCTKMCRIGKGEIDAATSMQNQFTAMVASHQAEHGLGASVENPKGSLLVDQPEMQAVFGTMDTPKPGWSFYRSEGCQLHVVYPGRDDPGRPIHKACLWISNFDLSSMELRCGRPAALLPTTHEHKHARGLWKVMAVRVSRLSQASTLLSSPLCMQELVKSFATRLTDDGGPVLGNGNDLNLRLSSCCWQLSLLKWIKLRFQRVHRPKRTTISPGLRSKKMPAKRIFIGLMEQSGFCFEVMTSASISTVVRSIGLHRSCVLRAFGRPLARKVGL